MKEYTFTVFTPCYNGSKTIKRVFDSMKSQTYSKWEWIIINDGSKDNSDYVIKNEIENFGTGKEKIIYLVQENKGKHVAWNRAVKMSNSDFFVPADCDDSFIPETLTFYNDKANELRGDLFCESNLSGISSCCFDPESNELVGTPYPFDGIISNDIELDCKYHVKGEKWGCIRTDLLKKNPFPELSGHYYPECFLWYSFPRDGFQKANYNKLLRGYYYEPSSITHSKTSRINRDRAFRGLHFNIWMLNNVGKLVFKYSIKEYIKIYAQIVRHSILLTLSIITSKKK